MAKLTVVAENKVGLGKGMIAEHGFCAHLDTGDTKILWDTGQGFCLPVNAPMLGVDLKKIDMIALSHGHFDHTGGLAKAMAMSGGARVVCHPACFDNKKVEREMFGKKFEVYIGMPEPRETLEGAGAKFDLASGPAEIAPGVHFFTGVPLAADFESVDKGFFIDGREGRVADDFPDDAFLAVVTDKGLSVLLGCAHRGMINSLTFAMDTLGVDKVYSVWGGTHLVERTPEHVDATIDALARMGVEKVGTAHCTGFHNEVKLANRMPEAFTLAAVGTMVDI